MSSYFNLYMSSFGFGLFLTLNSSCSFNVSLDHTWQPSLATVHFCVGHWVHELSFLAWWGLSDSFSSHQGICLWGYHKHIRFTELAWPLVIILLFPIPNPCFPIICSMSSFSPSAFARQTLLNIFYLIIVFTVLFVILNIVNILRFVGRIIEGII